MAVRVRFGEGSSHGGDPYVRGRAIHAELRAMRLGNPGPPSSRTNTAKVMWLGGETARKHR